jgi:UDP-N-acetylglucosamine--N-acetylmuramyl-(pentapeptide) pyrophosphoryl-undecaprenol N-acetylglucosamine transferase
MRILLAGGGSGGPVAPLLAVAEEIKKMDPNAEILFVGTKKGPERGMVEVSGYAFKSIPAAKFRRYFSLKNFTDLFVLIFSLFKARRVILDFKPDVIFSVGGFVAVPLCWMGHLGKVRIVIHQQDARPSLANKLVEPFAEIITTTFEETTKKFYTHPGLLRGERQKKIEWVGNPVRHEFFDATMPHKDFFKLHDKLPILLITGGGTGARQINEVAQKALPELVKAHQVVHITGKGKGINFSHPDYHQYEFLNTEFPTIMKLADIIVCRAGLSTIAELSVLGKISIVVPMPDSHQEDNADVLKRSGAAAVMYQDEFTPENLTRVINSLKFNVKRQESLKRNIMALMPKDAAAKLAKIVINPKYAK